MKKNIKGFTLIELLIVIAIGAILLAIALPSYQNYVLKSHRTLAINALLNLASQESRYYSTNNAYTTSLLTLGYANDPTSLSGYYNLDVKNVTVASATAPASFTLEAVPPTGGTQANDSCGSFTYTDLGVKAVTGTSTAADCWKQ